MKTRSLYLLMVLSLFVFINTQAWAASIADTYGLSPKSVGMGNAMAAHVDDWTSVYYNMSGLGKTGSLKENGSNNQLFFGYLYTAPQTKLDIPQRYYEEDGERTLYSTNADEDLDFGSLIIGTAVDLNLLYKMPQAISSARFGLALTVGDDLSVAKVNDIEPQTHNYLRLGRETQKMDIISGIGLGFLDDTFGVGFGVRTSFGGEGKVLLEDVQVSTDPQSPKGQTLMDLELDVSSWVAGAYLDLGKIAPPLKGADIGFCYRSPSKFEIDPFETAAVVQTGGIPLNLQLALFDYYYPATFTLGLAYRPIDKLTVALDIEYQKWSDYDVSSVASENYAEILPDLDDIFVFRVGGEFALKPHMAIFGGYGFQPSFVPDKATKGVVNWLDNDKHIASVGTLYNLGKLAGFQKDMVLSAAYQYQYLVERSVTKDEPTSLNPNYDYGGSIHTLILGLQF